MSPQQKPLERYEVLHELGRGAIGAVYAARDRSTGAAVALKTLDPALFSEPDAKLAVLFLENARAAGRLRHRNIVKVYDAGEAAGTAYVAMELLEGESLRNMLDNRPLSIARAIQIFDDIASALAYAHEEGMVHRGVRPSNIIVLRSGVAKLSDFGLGQIGEAALRYKSPEQVRRGPVDHRSDIFSLGAVFYEMLTRRAPFEGKPPPSKLNPLVPPALDGFVLRMLAGHPEERFADARILLRDLQRLEEGIGLGPGAGPGTDEPAASVPPGRVEPKLSVPVLDGEAFDHRDARFLVDREPWPQRSFGPRAASFAALALMLAAFATGLAVFLYQPPSPNEPRTAASRLQEGPVTAAAPQVVSAPAPTPAPPPVAEAIKEPTTVPAAPEAALPKQIVAEPSPPAKTESSLARASEPPVTASTAPATAKISEPQPGRAAKLIVAVSPQGELYIDGKHHGTTPPITTFELEPGMHRIEIRSGSWKPYLTYVTVQAGELRRIRHDFGAKPSGPPR